MWVGEGVDVLIVSCLFFRFFGGVFFSVSYFSLTFLFPEPYFLFLR